MANVLNRTTKQYIASANTPDYPVADWIHDPELSAVIGWDSKYWIITGDVVTLMDQTQRDTVDANEATVFADAESSSADTNCGGSNDQNWQGFREVIASLTRTHNKLARRIREVERALEDIRSTTGAADSIRAAIPLPSDAVISEGSAPATFTNLVDRIKDDEIADFRQTLRDKEGQV